MRKPMRPEMHPDLRPDLRPPLRPLRPLTDEDGEVRELTAEDFKGMRPLREVDPGLIEAVAEHRRKRGRPKSPAPKIYLGLRMAADVVESLKASGPGYNSRAEQALRTAGYGAAMADGVEDPLAELSRLVEFSHLKTSAKAVETDIVAASQGATKRAAKKAAKTKPARKKAENKDDPVATLARLMGSRPAKKTAAKRPAPAKKHA